jgi:spore coat polysaccharide biosynthesis protein SpsF
MGKTVACIIARTSSDRLPGKVLKKVTDQYTMLDFIIQRTRLCENIDQVYICTSSDPRDDILEDAAKNNDVEIYRGSLNDVADRLIQVAKITSADRLIRITGDNVFTSTEYLDQQIELTKQYDLDYLRLIGVPLGATSEVISSQALLDCYESIDPEVSEYLMLYIFDPDKYKCGVARIFEKDYSDITLTLDTKDDLERTRNIFNRFPVSGHLELTLKEIILELERDPLPGIIFESKGLIKYPYERRITYEEFKQDMSIRIKKSLLLSLNPI